MSDSFVQALVDDTNVTRTANGSKTLKTSKSALVDFFAQGGALRSSNAQTKIGMFTAAFGENPDYAMKALFYFRDIRGGQGERQLFRDILHYLAGTKPETVLKNLKFVPEFGRWDDALIALDGTPLFDDAATMLKEQLNKDIIGMNAGEKISMAAKWAPSITTSSKEVRKMAMRLCVLWGATPRNYRKRLSKLRAYLKITEVSISANKWSDVVYSAVPSGAMKLYKKAFSLHDGPRFGNFLTKVEKGEEKINSGTLYPYDLIKPILAEMSMSGSDIRVTEAQWQALPNYIPDELGNTLVVADVSGSMNEPNLLPISVSVSLALYFAERNKGPLAGHFMTFSSSPSFVKIQGSNIVEKVRNINQADWDMSTNLDAMFELILNTGINNGLSDENMPKRLVIISDMQFDACMRHPDKTVFERTKRSYDAAGYTMPQIFFWNVKATPGQSPVKFNDRGVGLVSGASASTFKTFVGLASMTPYDLMMNTLDNPRYAEIKA